MARGKNKKGPDVESPAKGSKKAKVDPVDEESDTEAIEKVEEEAAEATKEHKEEEPVKEENDEFADADDDDEKKKEEDVIPPPNQDKQPKTPTKEESTAKPEVELEGAPEEGIKNPTTPVDPAKQHGQYPPHGGAPNSPSAAGYGHQYPPPMYNPYGAPYGAYPPHPGHPHGHPHAYSQPPPPYYPGGGYPGYPPQMMHPHMMPPHMMPPGYGGEQGPPGGAAASPGRAGHYDHRHGGGMHGYPPAYPPQSPVANNNASVEQRSPHKSTGATTGGAAPFSPNGKQADGDAPEKMQDEQSEQNEEGSHLGTEGDDSESQPVMGAVTARVKIYVKSRHGSASEEVLARRARKNAQSRARAAKHRERVAEIESKPERNEEETHIWDQYQRRRQSKNDRSRERAMEKKEEIDRILTKPEKKRTRIELQFLETSLGAKKRKNEGDRLRRQRLKVMGLQPKGSSGGPGVTARGPIPGHYPLLTPAEHHLAYYAHMQQQPPPGAYGGYPPPPHHPGVHPGMAPQSPGGMYSL
jgi:hypothetical protein